MMGLNIKVTRGNVEFEDDYWQAYSETPVGEIHAEGLTIKDALLSFVDEYEKLLHSQAEKILKISIDDNEVI